MERLSVNGHDAPGLAMPQLVETVGAGGVSVSVRFWGLKCHGCALKLCRSGLVCALLYVPRHTFGQ